MLRCLLSTRRRRNLTCHFCIVGCGYHVYKWDENIEGGRAPHQNALGLDFRKQLPPLAPIMTPAMTNVIKDKDGRRYNIMIVPDKACSVNQGLSSTRGGWLATVMYTADGVGKERLQDAALSTSATVVRHELGRRAGASTAASPRRSSTPTVRADSSSTVSTMAAPAAASRTPGAPASSCSPRCKTPMVRIHNRPAYNSECHATRDMGIGELNNSYEDAELADVHRGDRRATRTRRRPTTSSRTGFRTCRAARWTKKQEVVPGRSRCRQARIIFVDPRRSRPIAIAEQVAGKDNVLHLDIEPGTDIALFNGSVHLRRRPGLASTRTSSPSTRPTSTPP